MESYIIKKEGDNTVAKPIIDTSLPSFSDIDSAIVFNKVSTTLLKGGKIFIKNVPDNPYLINNTCYFRQNNLIITSDFATIKCNQNDVIAMMIGKLKSETKIGENAIIEGLIFDANHPIIHNGTSLYVAAYDNVNIRNCIIKNAGIRDGIRISAWSETEYRKNGIDIEKCHFYDASISLGGIDSGSLHECTFMRGPFAEYSTIDLSFGEQNNSMIRNFNLHDNKFFDINRGNRIISGFQRVEDVYIENNTFKNCTKPAIQSTTTVSSPEIVLLRRRVHIKGNKFINCQKAIDIHATDTEISSNMAFDLTSYFIVSRGANCTIEKNRARDVNATGILVYGPRTKVIGNYLENVSISGNRQYYRLEAGADGCDIIGNTARCTGPSVTDAFLEIIGADSNLFSMNRIEGYFINRYVIKGTNSIVLHTFGYTPRQIENITVGISPFIYANNDHYVEEIQIVGGDVSNITFIRRDVQKDLNIKSGIILLEPKDSIKVIYTIAPTMIKIPH